MQVHEETVKITTGDLILAQGKDLAKRMDRLETRLDRLEARLDKCDERIDKLADKIDALRTEIKTASNHGNIMTASVVGIALAVIYSVLK